MFLSMGILFAQTAAPASSGLDWQQLAAVYGPLVGVLSVVLKIHWDMINKTIPSALRAIRIEQWKNRRVMTRVLRRLGSVHMCRKKRSSNNQAAKKKPTRGKRRPNNSP